MGSEQDSNKKNPFEMNVQFIGINMENFKYSISKTNSKYSIKNYWTFNYVNTNVDAQIKQYFDKLQAIKNGEDQTINLKESLLVKVENIFDPEVNLILDSINRLGQTQYMPLVLFLVCNTNNMQLKIDPKYKRLDPRLIITAKYDENNLTNIDANLLRFCSIHNELGDTFTVGKGDEAETYDLIDTYFPFNINIACIGRFGQGKSTGVNVLLNEYKAKESSKGSSQTRELTYYQVTNQPIRILDIPGFEDKDTVKKAVEKFQKCGEKINKIKDNLHIVLYFLSYTESRAFSNLELPIVEELCKHQTSKVIYVITHSDPNMDETDKEDKIISINDGLQNLTKESSIHYQAKKGGMLEANKNNVVFVNFHRDNKTKFEKFGIKDLFKKIYDFFILSEDYKSSNQTMNPDIIKKNAERLRAQAEAVVKANKIGGAIVGIIPADDWLLQKFVIKKNAAQKVGQIYGIDVSFIDEKDEKNPKNNINKYKPEFLTSSVDQSQLDLEIKGDDLISETTSYKVGNSFKIAGDAGSYISGGVAIGSTLMRASTTAAEGANAIATGIGTTVLRAAGVGLMAVGAVVGVALGGYFTSKHCNELIDKFEEYYIKNAQKIGNSYQRAAQYLLNQEFIE